MATPHRDTLFGLPRYVLAILRHMEVHSERLKWSLAEESNQLTLTLTWRFDNGKPHKSKDSLWKRLQRTLGIEKTAHDPTMIAGCCSRLVDTQSTPTIRRFLLEEQTDGLTVTSSGGSGHYTSALLMATSQSSVDGWQHPVGSSSQQSPAPIRSRRTRATSASSLTARCRSLPGRMESAHSASQPLSGRTGGVSASTTGGGGAVVGSGCNDGWSTGHRVGHQARTRKQPNVTSSSSSASHNSQPNGRRQQPSQQPTATPTGYYSNSRVSASPSFVTSSSHLTLPLNRSPARSVASQQHFVTSQRSVAQVSRQPQPSQHRQPQQQNTATAAASLMSPSHFSWPGISFEAATVSESVPDEGQSSGLGTPPADQASPSLPSSTSTATNPCIALMSAGPFERSPATRNEGELTGNVVISGGGSGAGARTDEEDVELTDAEPNSESTMGGAAGHVTSEFDVLDEDYWLTSKRRWSRSDADVEWSATEWAPVVTSAPGDAEDSVGIDTPPPTTASQTEEEVVDQVNCVADEAEEDEEEEEEVEEMVIVEQPTADSSRTVETVMKCIASCDKVLLRHSTTIR